MNRVKELDFIANEQQKFLDAKVGMWGNKVGLASFPRSGNSFIRKFLEQITGITTGNEMTFGDPAYQNVGLIGEGHAANDRVWITKTHHPMEVQF